MTRIQLIGFAGASQPTPNVFDTQQSRGSGDLLFVASNTYDGAQDIIDVTISAGPTPTGPFTPIPPDPYAHVATNTFSAAAPGVELKPIQWQGRYLLIDIGIHETTCDMNVFLIRPGGNSLH